MIHQDWATADVALLPLEWRHIGLGTALMKSVIAGAKALRHIPGRSYYRSFVGCLVALRPYPHGVHARASTSMTNTVVRQRIRFMADFRSAST